MPVPDRGNLLGSLLDSRLQPQPPTMTPAQNYNKIITNNIVYTAFNVRAADDAAEFRELLDQPRAFESPAAYNRYLVLTEDYENELPVAYPLLSKRMVEREVSGYFQRPRLSLVGS